MKVFLALFASFSMILVSVGPFLLRSSSAQISSTGVSIKKAISLIEGKDLPLADTEILENQIIEIFDSDMTLHRRVIVSGVKLTVFVMYWNQSESNPFNMGMHVPDNCFVSNGMKLTRKSKKEIFLDLPKAEYREFNNSGRTQYVLYWHFVDEKVIDYEKYGNGRTFGFLFQNFKGMLFPHDQMLYFRIVSDEPFDKIARTVEFEKIKKVLDSIWSELNRIPA